MAAFVLCQGALLALGRAERQRERREEPPAREAASRWELARSPARMSPRELRVLPGIGARLALAIADARRAREGRAPAREGRAPAGEALAWEDVRGIGPRTAARVRAWLAERGLETELGADPGERSRRARDALESATGDARKRIPARTRPRPAAPAARSNP